MVGFLAVWYVFSSSPASIMEDETPLLFRRWRGDGKTSVTGLCFRLIDCIFGAFGCNRSCPSRFLHPIRRRLNILPSKQAFPFCRYFQILLVSLVVSSLFSHSL